MTPLEVDCWATELWRHYEPGIATGKPFYLAADARLIGEVGAHLGYEKAHAAILTDFHESCQTLLEKAGATWRVAVTAFESIAGAKYSRVICLAVQQVLVVERMLNDEHYSENSYFPRYHEVLGIADKDERKNPLRTGFQEIWEVLANEILSVPGATPNTITFSKGSGINLNRSLPFSQALFTSHDLAVLHAAAPSLSEQSDPNYMLRVLWQVRRNLSMRARRLIGVAWADSAVADRICGQVRSFLSGDAAILQPKPHTMVADIGYIVAYPDEIDVFDFDDVSECFSVYCCYANEQRKDELLAVALESKLPGAVPLLLVPNGDGFRELPHADEFSDRDPMIVILQERESAAFQNHVALSGGAQFTRRKSSLPNHLQLLYYDGSVGYPSRGLLKYRNVPNREPGLTLDGGLFADARSRTYLSGYPPHAIRCHGANLHDDDKLVVCGSGQEVRAFLESLKGVGSLGHFSIEFGGERLEFSIAPRREHSSALREFGYAIRNGQLALTPEFLSPGQPSLRGTLLVGLTKPRASRLSRQDLLLLIGPGKRVAISKSDQANLLAELERSAEISRLAALAVRQVGVTRSVPIAVETCGLLRRLRLDQTRVPVAFDPSRQ